MAKYQFKNLKQLERYMEKQIEQALQKVAKATMKQLKENVKNGLEQKTIQQYERTYELLNSISYTKVAKVYGRYVVSIYYDTSKIYPYITNGVRWNKHADFWGNDVSEYIPLWLEKGTDNEFYSHKGLGTIDDTFEWISAEYNRLFREALKCETNIGE